MSSVAMYNPMSSMDDGECKDCLASRCYSYLVYTGVSVDAIVIAGPSMVTSIYWSIYPLVRVSVDAIVTLVSMDHPCLMVTSIYWSTPLSGIRGCHSYSGIPGPSTVTSIIILVYPPCQSIHGCRSYSGIPGPSMVTSIYWSTPLSEYLWMP